MDLGAFIQIGAIESIAKANGIEVPRLRGYRLMENEKPVSEEDIQSRIADQQSWIYQKCVSSYPRFYPESCISGYDESIKRLEKKYLICEMRSEIGFDGTPVTYRAVVGFRWHLLHGKARKRLKLALKHNEKRVRKQMAAFNRYAGQSNVLYIHARIGGRNWDRFGGNDLEQQPWFLERVDDSFDNSYCDIYARIDTESIQIESEGSNHELS